MDVIYALRSIPKRNAIEILTDVNNYIGSYSGD